MKTEDWSERQDGIREGAAAEEPTPTPDGPRQPWVLGVIGLALMLVGYQLLNYAPPRRDTEQVRLLKEKAAEDPALFDLSERLGQIEVPSTRPYKAAGTIALYGGLLLFLAAGIKMYHHQPPPAKDEGPEEAST